MGEPEGVCGVLGEEGEGEGANKLSKPWDLHSRRNWQHTGAPTGCPEWGRSTERGRGRRLLSPTLSPAASVPSQPRPRRRPWARSRAQGGQWGRDSGRPDSVPEPNSPASSVPAYLRRAPAPARRPGRAPGSGDREEELGPRGALQAEVKRSPGPHRRIRVDRRGRMGLDRAATEGWADRRRVCTSAQRGGLRQAPPESWGGNLEPVAAAQSSCPQAAGTPPGAPCPQSTFPPHPLSSRLSSPPPPPRPPVPPAPSPTPTLCRTAPTPEKPPGL